VDDLYALHIRNIVKEAKREGWPFLFICLYLFLEYVRPQTIYSQIDILPWVFLSLVFAAVSLVSRGAYRKKPNIINKLIVLYAIVVLISSTFSQSPAISFARLRIFFDWFFIYFLIVTIVNNKKRFYLFLLLFLFCSFKMSQHGFLTWAMRGFAFQGWGVTGAPGWFRNSGEVGIQMCIFVPLAVAFIFAVYRYLSKVWRVFFLLMPFTGVGTLIASSSRGALVGFAIGALRSLLITPKIFFKSIIILALLTSLVVQLIPDESMQRFENSGSDRTSLHRLERWKHGLDAMNKFPLFGVGFESWTDFYPRNYNLDDKGSRLVHNIFVQCGSELGYTGLILFVLMIFSCFTTTRKVREVCQGHEDKFLSIMSYGFDAALLGFLGSGFFVTVLYYPFFWIHCAMTVSLYSAATSKIPVTKKGSSGNRAL